MAGRGSPRTGCPQTRSWLYAEILIAFGNMLYKPSAKGRLEEGLGVTVLVGMDLDVRYISPAWSIGQRAHFLAMGPPISPFERSHTSEEKEQVETMSTFPSPPAQDTAGQCSYLSFGCHSGHLTGLPSPDCPCSVLLYTRAHFTLLPSIGFRVVLYCFQLKLSWTLHPPG